MTRTTTPASCRVTRRRHRAFRVLLGLVVIVCTVHEGRGQREYDQWCFGWGFGLDFRGGSPVPIDTTSIWQMEGSASICDHVTGALLFYTDGITVWDARGGVMPNGTGLMGHYSSAQSALFVPDPCDTSQYYLFTADHQGYDDQRPPTGIHYSIVDRRLNGGLGAVLAAGKNTLLQGQASERLTAVAHSNGFDYWVLTHSWGGNQFYAWRVSASGVSSTPVVSRAGFDVGSDPQRVNYALGILKASPDGRRLAMTTWIEDLVELFSFDPSTGVVSNPLTLSAGPRTGQTDTYGVTFSPDNNRLYHGASGEIYQYDLRSGTPAAILASRTRVPNNGPTLPAVTLGAMQIGPDGKIYMPVKNFDNPPACVLGIVDDPNADALNCGYTQVWMRLPYRDAGWLGLPNNIDARQSPDTSTKALVDPLGPVSLCQGESVTLTAVEGFLSYEWSTGETTRSIRVSTSGTYHVRLYMAPGCFRERDIVVTVHPPPRPAISTEGPPVICEGDSVRLFLDRPYRSVQWGTGENDTAIFVRATGMYYVEVVDSNGCSGRDSVEITFQPSPSPAILGGGTYCKGDTAMLDAGAGYVRYLWSTGDTTRTIERTVSATLSVQVWNDAGCAGTSPPVDVTIREPERPQMLPGEVVEICKGETAVVTVAEGYVDYAWSNGDTGRVLRTDTAGLFVLTAKDPYGCRTVPVEVRVIVHPLPPAPTITDLGDSLEAGAAWGWEWSYAGEAAPGGNGRRVESVRPGVYGVRIIDSNGCYSPVAYHRVDRPHRFSFDTLSLTVGQRGLLTLRSNPPVRRQELLRRYSIVFRLPPASIFLHRVFDIDGTLLPVTPGDTAGEYRVERQGGIVSGDALLRVELEGLTTGVPLNIADIRSALSIENDSIGAGNDGLIILSGCDIGRGFAWGRRAALLRVFPNPAPERSVTVMYRAPEGSRVDLVLLDGTGAEVARWKAGTGDGLERKSVIALPWVSAGFYWLELRNGVEHDVTPLVLSR